MKTGTSLLRTLLAVVLLWLPPAPAGVAVAGAGAVPVLDSIPAPLLDPVHVATPLSPWERARVRATYGSYYTGNDPAGWRPDVPAFPEPRRRVHEAVVRDQPVLKVGEVPAAQEAAAQADTGAVSAIATGDEHTCALTAAGGVKCWGANYSGQLGDGSATQRTAPVDVSGLGSGISAIAAGDLHSCALAAGGGVKCWGQNGSGQLGDGTSGNAKTTPVDVSGLGGGISAIAAGGLHTCALTAAGGVKCWGGNRFGQLGDGTTMQRSTPVDVVGLGSGISAIAAGDGHSCALTAAGGVKCWGQNGNGQLGDGSTTRRTAPVDVSGLGSGVSAISAGFYHSCALTAGDGVKCWGRNIEGQLGDGTTTNRTAPVAVSGLGSGVSAIAAGGNHSCALTAAGGVKCWGYNAFGQLGDGTTTDRTAPVDVAGMSGITLAFTPPSRPRGQTVAISGGGHPANLSGLMVHFGGTGHGTDPGTQPCPSGGVHAGTATTDASGNLTGSFTLPSCATDGVHTVYVIDPNNGDAVIASGPFTVFTVASVKLAAGYGHNCALTAAGGVKCWGSNDSGQLGDGTTTNRLTPVAVSGLGGGVSGITAGGSHSCALTEGGGVKCWGRNFEGQLGDGSTTNRAAPVDVSGLTSGVSAIAAGESHTCALTAGGGVKCWGRNDLGQLGDGSTTQRTAPVAVSGLGGGVSAITAGHHHSCALTAAGGVKCWGWNFYGQLGDGTTTDRTAPVVVSGLGGGVSAIAAGRSHSCALSPGGGVKCWGRNDLGQLGDGSTTQSTAPVDVSGLGSGVSAIAAGHHHSCALTAAGGVKCWGYNSSGGLGDGTTTNRMAPVNVSGLGTGISAIALGGNHTCALTAAGGVKCWGENGYGQLGDGTTTGRTAPVAVVGLGPAIVVKDPSTGATMSSAAAGSQVRVVGSGFPFPGSGMIHLHGTGMGTPPACPTSGVHLANFTVVAGGGFDVLVTIPDHCYGSMPVLAIMGEITVALTTLFVNPTAPVLNLPLDGSLLPGTSTELSWNNPPGVTQVHIQVTPVGSGEPARDIVVHSSVSRYFLTDLLTGSGYTWRVRVATSTTPLGPADPGWQPWSETRTFRTMLTSLAVNSTLDQVDANPGDGLCAAASGACTLRAAVMEANALFGHQTITVPAGTYTLTLAGRGEDAAATGDLDIRDAVTITGAGAGSTVIDGGALDRVFDIRGPTGTTTTAITGLTIRNGSTSGLGGGIFNDLTLNLSGVVIMGNSASLDGGGIYNLGTLTLSDSSVRGNTSLASGRAGGIYNQGSVNGVRSTLAANTGTAFFNGGGGTATLVNSTISQNTAADGAGAIYNVGNDMWLIASTVTGNSAAVGGLLTNPQTNNSTARIFLKHTIVAGNVGTFAPNCAGSFTTTFTGVSFGHNIGSDAGCGLTATGDLPNTDPLLAALAGNGGTTQTHRILPGSLAIDAIPNADCTDASGAAIATDQRGYPRPRDGDGNGEPRCDIGSFEHQNATSAFVSPFPARGAHGFPFGIPPQVEVRHGATRDTGNSVAEIVLRLTPASAGAAAVTCTGGTTRTTASGLTSFNNCRIDKPGLGYVLEAVPVAPDITPATTPIIVSCAGDSDGDGVNIVDFSRLLQGFGKSYGQPGYNTAVDFDGSDATDIVDFSILVARFGAPACS